MGWKTFVVVGIVAAYIAYQSVDRFDPVSVKDKRVVITGASSGIGEEIAYHYARFGARVLITARRAALLKKVAAKCEELGAREALYIPLDMAKAEDTEALIDEAKKRLGGLDHLVLNHVATASPKFWEGDSVTAFDSVLERTIDINFYAYVRLATHATPMLRESNGNIGVVSSGAGKIGLPFSPVYCASKFALHGFFDALRQEYEMQHFGISISTFVLGGFNTTNAARDSGRVFRPQILSGNPSDAALRIVKGTTNREREVFFPWHLHLLLLRDFAPTVLEWIAQMHSFDQDTIAELLKAQGN